VSAVTHGHLLNGRVRYAQPVQGFRSGIEPVLLAASISAGAGQRVLEGGTGAGAGLLCLMTRAHGLVGVGIEIDPDQAELARENAAANAFYRHASECPRRDDGGSGCLTVLTGDIETVVPNGIFDHAFANPPYHPASGTASPQAVRVRAKQARPDLLIRWATALTRPLRARGTLTFILPAARLPACIAAMEAASCPVDAVLALWPKPRVPAKLTIVRGIKGGRGPMRLLPGLVLHEPNGRFTSAADAILRDGAPLCLDH
jgi:tRNA1Val (adenine37-N6)-methyltransferase